MSKPNYDIVIKNLLARAEIALKKNWTKLLYPGAGMSGLV